MLEEREYLITEKDREALCLTLVSIHELIEALLEMLHPGCLHPMDERDDLSTMGHLGEWRCRKCGYEHIPEEVENGG